MRIRPAHVNTCYLATVAIRILELYDSSLNLFGIGSELLTIRFLTGPLITRVHILVLTIQLSGKGVLENDSQAVYYNK